MRILCVGEILWDVIDRTEHLGGAPLNFAAHAQKLGHEVFPLSGVGDDERGHRALELIAARGISTELIAVIPGKPTGTAEVELDLDGKPTFQIVRPAAYDFVDLSSDDLQRVGELKPDWIYFGTLFHISGQALASTLRLVAALPSAKRFYDVNLREGHWNLRAVEQLASHSTVVKLSDSEAECLDAEFGAEDDCGSIENCCRRWQERFQCEVVCITCGERGCAILREGQFMQVPGFRVEVADTVGAGDAFAAGFLHGLDQGWDTSQIGRFGNACGAVVASKPGAIPDWSVEEVQALLG
jgi:fructokinase